MKKVFLVFFVSLCFGIIAVLLWTGPAYAPPPGCSPVAQNLAMCNAELGTCNDELEACVEAAQVFPGDGYLNTDAFGVPGHGPALIYTDNPDGTFTDNNTKFVWEKKLAEDHLGGNCTAEDQADRSVHCVNNTYTWSSGDDLTDPDGTLFTMFLAGLNNNAFAGFNDWCIPNVKRIQSIVNYSMVNPASSVPGETAASNYWSSTTDALVARLAWFVNFSSGNVVIISKDGVDFFFARAVHPCS